MSAGHFMVRLGSQAYHGITSVFSSSKSRPTFHPYKLLLIGETGSGKTSFLNLLCNYAIIKELGFRGFEQLKSFHDVQLENAQSKQMESKTSGTALYNVELNGLQIGVIDTPGFGDSRGMDEDKRHIQRIISALKEVEQVHCICLVINGRLSRMTASLRYVLAEITAILPKEILDNVVVIFTNTANVLDLYFEIESLSAYFGKDVKKCFFIENPYCQFERAKMKQNKIAQHLLVETVRERFEKTGKELDKMHHDIKDLRAVHANYFTQLHEKRIEVECKVIEMLAEYDSQVNLTNEMKKAQERVEAAQNTKELNKDFQTYTTTTRWKRVGTPYHNTLCGAPGCYKVCHERCGCVKKSFDKEIFCHCSGIRGQTCCTCGHDYRSHFHDECKMEDITETIPLVDDEMKKKFEEADRAEKAATMAKSDIAKQIKESEYKKKDLSQKLLLAMEEFHELGLNKNYAKLLETHLFAVQQRKEASDNQEDIASLANTESEIQKKLTIVKATLDEPWSTQADPKFQGLARY